MEMSFYWLDLGKWKLSQSFNIINSAPKKVPTNMSNPNALEHPLAFQLSCLSEPETWEHAIIASHGREDL